MARDPEASPPRDDANVRADLWDSAGNRQAPPAAGYLDVEPTREPDRWLPRTLGGWAWFAALTLVALVLTGFVGRR